MLHIHIACKIVPLQRSAKTFADCRSETFGETSVVNCHSGHQ